MMKKKVILLLLILSLTLTFSVQTVFAEPGRPPVVQSVQIEFEDDQIIDVDEPQDVENKGNKNRIKAKERVLYKLLAKFFNN